MEKCPICEGTGFRDGKICPCITGPKDSGIEMPDCFKDIFGLGGEDGKRMDKKHGSTA
jgi:hypothetical protein